MLKTNYHTHMKYCNHASGMVIDYVKKAVDLGFIELGMSDHAPVLKDFMSEEEYQANWCFDTMMLEQVEDYLNQINECRIKYPNIKIYSGFESEYLPEEKSYYASLRSMVDYLNLGVHFLRDKNGNILNVYKDINYSNVYEYLNTVEKALETGLFTTLVHPDIFMYGYKDKDGNHNFDDACIDITRKIAKLAVKYDIYLEVNTNGLSYCKDKNDRSTWLYPYPKFWEIIKEYPVKILVGADAHSPEALDNINVKLVLDFVKDMGLKVEEKMVIKNGKF